MVGVGNGPWEQMKHFDDKLPMRAFDNFQFVNLTEIFTRGAGSSKEQVEADFALQAMMEVPEQYRVRCCWSMLYACCSDAHAYGEDSLVRCHLRC